MRTIIAGSRTITDYAVVAAAIQKSGFTITEVVSGAARGVDELGERWANENSVPIRQFPAQWERYGKSAGPLRNNQMAHYAQALIAIWDGQSYGTKSMIHMARKLRMKVCIIDVSRTEKSGEPHNEPAAPSAER